jgi:signal transduction histidine kinase
MYDSLLRHLSSYSTMPLTSNEFELVKQAFIPGKLKRNQFFLQEGDVCKYFGFIVKGALRLYIVDQKGGEHTLQLATENWMIGDLESFMTSELSRYNIEACEDADLPHKIEPIYLNSHEILPLATILNEAITNALKYAFPNGRHGEIRLMLHRMASGMVQMQIRDNGVGFPAGYRPTIGQSLGFTLITGLANQLEGYCEIEEEGGVVVTIRFTPRVG